MGRTWVKLETRSRAKVNKGNERVRRRDEDEVTGQRSVRAERAEREVRREHRTENTQHAAF